LNAHPESGLSRDQMLISLRNPEKNIEYVARVLQWKASERGMADLTSLTDEQKSTLFAAYNGSGDAAQTYGVQTLEYYNVFSSAS